MPRFGAHLSIQGGVDKAVERVLTIRAECLQIFLKSPAQWRFGPLSDETVGRFRTAAREADLTPLVGHASYLVNLASPDRALYERSRRCILEEWDRSERLGLDGLVLHPGAHMGSGEAAGLARIARCSTGSIAGGRTTPAASCSKPPPAPGRSSAAGSGI